ncbi:MAG: hypothetical protein ACPGU1_15955 [Myxococcota bacterium]
MSGARLWLRDLAMGALIASICMAFGGCASGYPDDCLGLGPQDATACVEEGFWPAFQADFTEREPVFNVMSGVIAEQSGQVPRIQFLRALLGVAIQTEELAMNPSEIEVTEFIANMRGDLHSASEAYPDNDFYRSWRLSADLITAMFLSDTGAVDALFEESIDHALSDSENIMAIASTWMLFPMETGLPDRGLEIMDTWVLEGHAYDIQNTEQVPYSKPGTFLMLGDLYARMGKRDMAAMNYEQSLNVDGSADWPYRYLAEGALSTIDETMAAFEALPDDAIAAGQMISFGANSCKMCHARPGPVR